MSSSTYQKHITSHTSIGEGVVGHQSDSAEKMVSPTGASCATEHSSSSESNSTPPTSPPQASPSKHMKPTNGHEHCKHERYVKLKDTCTENLTWSNNPRDLDLYGAFSEAKPNLSSDFRVEGLRLILKDMYRDMYILRDAEHNYYLWDPWEGHLLQVSSEYATEDDLDDYVIEGLDGVEKIVNNIIRHLTWAMEDAKAVYRS